MVDLFKLAVEKPVSAIIVALCVVVVSNVSGLADVKQAVAVIEEQQIGDNAIQVKVSKMNDMLIRMDANLEIVKNRQEHGNSPYLVPNN